MHSVAIWEIYHSKIQASGESWDFSPVAARTYIITPGNPDGQTFRTLQFLARRLFIQRWSLFACCNPSVLNTSLPYCNSSTTMVLDPTAPSHVVCIVVPTIFFALALAAFALRLYVRYSTRLIFLDDYFLTAAVIFITGFFISYEAAVANGIGLPSTLHSPDRLRNIFKSTYAQYHLYSFAAYCLRFSLAWQLMRFLGESLIWRVALWTLIAAMTAFLFMSEVILLIVCRPLSAMWNPAGRQHAKCLSPTFLEGWNEMTAGTSPCQINNSCHQLRNADEPGTFSLATFLPTLFLRLCPSPSLGQ